MTLRNLRPLLYSLLLVSLHPIGSSAAPAPEAQALIDELGLTAASQPLAERADWKPARVVVALPPRMSKMSPEYEEQLRAAAGDIELVFDRSGNLAPSAEMLAGADAFIGFCSPLVLKNAGDQLLWLHNYPVGMDQCTGASSAQLQKIIFTNTKRLSGPAIAEHTLAMLLALTHNLPAYVQAQQQAKWQRNLSANVTFGELKGKTLLVAGLGGIGTEIAWRAHGLGMRVIATRNSSRTGPAFVEYVGLADELFKLAGQADVVVNTLPLTPATNGLFNKAFFNAVKPGAIYLSVGRGQTTVTADLIAALEAGTLFGAGLDVTDPEPLPGDSPLWRMPNVIITPHVATAGGESTQRSIIIAVENLRRYVAGEALLNVVDLGKGY